MRLIFKGKILKDEMTLDEYKITNELTVHLVKGSNKGAAKEEGSSLGATTTEPSASDNAAGANPLAGFGGMPMGGMGGFGGMPMGGMGGMPGMGF